MILHWLDDTLDLVCDSPRCLTLVALEGRRLDEVSKWDKQEECVYCHGREEHREHDV